jgi:hypothetical protein
MSAWEEEKKVAFRQSGKTDGLQWKMVITPKGSDGFKWYVQTGSIFGNSWHGERETLEEAKRRAECVLEKALEVHSVAKRGLG